MMEAIRFGIDLAKSVFQIHGVDASGGMVVQRQLRREQMLSFFGKHPPAMSNWLQKPTLDGAVGRPAATRSG